MPGWRREREVAAGGRGSLERLFHKARAPNKEDDDDDPPAPPAKRPQRLGEAVGPAHPPPSLPAVARKGDLRAFFSPARGDKIEP